jgi:hypothetical protein
LFSFSLTSFAALSHAFAIVLAARDQHGTLNRLKAADQVAKPLNVDVWLPMQPGAIGAVKSRAVDGESRRAWPPGTMAPTGTPKGAPPHRRSKKPSAS